MELFLLNLSAFFRPIFSIDIEGTNYFDLAAIGIFCALAIAYMYTAAVRKDIRFSGVDAMIAAFAIWVFCNYAIYYEKTDIRTAAQMVIPLVTYVIAKNILSGTDQYLRLLRILLVGFSIPLLTSVIVISMGGGIDEVNYWSSTARWKGAYVGSHSFGHNMAFLVFVLSTYYVIVKQRQGEDRHSSKSNRSWILLGYAGVAIWALALSQVRTAIIGLIIFLLGCGWFYNRKALFIGLLITVGAVLALSPILMPILFPDVYRGLEEGDAALMGSGRPEIWQNVLDTYLNLPLDQKLAGMGVGNKTIAFMPGVYDAHNDYFSLLIQIGIVGVILYICIQVLMLAAILRISGKERYLFLALFVSVVFMNVSSNSYVSRFDIAQMYYIFMCYIELARNSATSVSAPYGIGGQRKGQQS